MDVDAVAPKTYARWEVGDRFPSNWQEVAPFLATETKISRNELEDFVINSVNQDPATIDCELDELLQISTRQPIAKSDVRQWFAMASYLDILDAIEWAKQ